VKTETNEILIEEIQTLRETVAKLHARVDFLETKMGARIDVLEQGLSSSIKTAHGYDDALQRYCDMLKKYNDDAFDRIIHLELKVFPHLASDLDALDKVIGQTGDLPECKHEQRKP
jgi:hypothetical protein